MGEQLRTILANLCPAYPLATPALREIEPRAHAGGACIPLQLTAGSPADHAYSSPPFRAAYHLPGLDGRVGATRQTLRAARHDARGRGRRAGSGACAGRQERARGLPPPVGLLSDHRGAGTIIIDTSERFLYLIQPNNTALRYGIGVGRDGFQWNGLLKVTRKAEWPDWTPPSEMIERQPYLPRFMAGGPGNPMGARALYLGNTVYRIHGTNAPETIGHAVSSGCFRLVNEQIMDLYDRVHVGAKVIVQQ